MLLNEATQNHLRWRHSNVHPKSLALNKDLVYPSPPCRHGGNLCPISIDFVPVEFPAVRVHVNVARAQPALAFPDEPANPKENDDGRGEIGLEEALRIVDAATGWGYSDVELVF